MNLFVFGLGYSAEYFVRENRADFADVSGTVRTADKAARLGREIPGLDVLRFDADVADPRIEEKLAAANALVISIAPGAGDPVLARYRQAICDSPIRSIVYLSTVGVYGGQNGETVDEASPVVSSTRRGVARIAAESAWRELGATTGKHVFVLRLAGIYGPGRNAIVNLRASTARRIVRPGQVFNRIHVADIGQAIGACLGPKRDGGVFNVCDDEPSPPQDVLAYAAALIGVAPPPEIAFEDASLSPMARSFWTNNQRVSNRRMREDLQVALRYPTYREGLASLANDP